MPSSSTNRRKPRWQSSWGAGALLAVPFAALAVLPWCIAPGPHSALLSMALGLVAGGLAWRARPLPGVSTPPIAGDGSPVLVRLTCAQSGRGRGDLLYAAERVRGDERTVVAQGEEPAQVLEQAFRHAQLSRTTLRPGWGLSKEDIEALTATSAAGPTARLARSANLRVRRWPGARGATITLIAVSMVVLVVTSMGARLYPGQLSNLSLMLAVLAVLLPLALSTLTFTHMHVVLAAERLSFYRSSLGWRRLEASFEVGEVLHVCATSPSGRFHKHLLLRTVLGLECIGCAEASRVVHAVHEGWKHTDGRATD